MKKEEPNYKVFKNKKGYKLFKQEQGHQFVLLRNAKKYAKLLIGFTGNLITGCKLEYYEQTN